ncbi:MAG: TetR family transcriptional regulator [Acidimicrobiales bacterium]|nr:TetR family transcriptional regulator [Acidimicrobiales bacterium]
MASQSTVRQPLDKERVVDMAAKLADRDGLDSITLTKVAKNLGVRQPALYRHVDSYQDLVRSLGLLGREILAEALTDATMGVSGDDAVAALGHAWRKVVADHPGLYAATDRFPCAGDAELEEAVERIVDIIGRSLEAFDLDDDHRVHAARALRAAFHGFAHLESGDGYPSPHEVDETFDDMIELLCAGIRSQAT